MKNKAISGNSLYRSTLYRFLPYLVLLTAMLLSAYTTWNMTAAFLDSDAASELVLSRHLAQTGRLVSREWIYSTELRLLNTQLVYTPLFLLLNDWHMIRFLGAMLLQGILLLSYGYLVRSAGMSRTVFCYGGALQLLPVGVAYGRIVLYHCYYIPHISISFVIIGLTLRFAQETNWKDLRVWVRLLILLALSAVGGMGSVRQLMMTHGPLLLTVALLAFMEDWKEKDRSRAAILSPRNLQQLLVGVFSAAASVVGLKFNDVVLRRYFTFDDQTGTMLQIQEISFLDNLFSDVLHQFGFRENLPMLSLMGVLSLGGAVAAIVCLVLSAKRLLDHRKGDDIRSAVVEVFLLIYIGVMIAVFLLTGGNAGYFYELYVVLCLNWAAPMLVAQLERNPEQIHPLNVRRLFIWLAAIMMVANGLANMAFYCGNERFAQSYRGLAVNDPNTKQEMQGIKTFLTEGGYERGYAYFWSGNVVTELTNGTISMINVEGRGDSLAYKDWLTLLPERQAPNGKPFLLLDKIFNQHNQCQAALELCTLVYEDLRYQIYDITNHEAFVEMLNQ